MILHSTTVEMPEELITILEYCFEVYFFFLELVYIHLMIFVTK